MSTVPCVAARQVARLGMEQPPLLSAHMRRCLACQVEIARTRRIARVMALMGATAVPAPPDLMPRVVAAVEGSRRARRRPGALLPAAAVTAVAGAVAVSVALRRRAHAASLP